MNLSRRTFIQTIGPSLGVCLMAVCAVVAGGPVNSATQNAEGQRCKSPLSCIHAERPDRALAMLKADPKWIKNPDDAAELLRVAAQNGYAKVVKWLLEHNADVNAKDADGQVALHLTDSPEVVAQILKLEKKPDLNIVHENSGETPLLMAASQLARAETKKEKQNWQAIVTLLLRAGATYDIWTATCLNDLNRVKAILKANPKLANNPDGGSPLRLAARLGRLELCRYLVKQRGVDVNDFERGVGYPIIKEALAHPAVVRLLIESGADLKTPITWQGARTGVWIIGDNATALHHAAADGVPETIKLLIDKGVPVFATDTKAPAGVKGGKTAIEVAALFGRTENVIAILEHPQFQKQKFKRRKVVLNECLLRAVQPYGSLRKSSHPRLIERLIKEGAAPNAKFNGATVLQIAASGVHPTNKKDNAIIRSIFDVLVKHAAKIDLYSAVAVGDQTIVDRLLKKDPQTANSRGPRGIPALHTAVDMNHEAIVRRLLKAGAEVDIRNNAKYVGIFNGTALHSAAFWGRDRIAALLIASGANVNALGEDDYTPLHSAARLTNVNVARLLLKHGAKIDARDKRGKTPLDYCRELKWKNWRETEKLLLEYRRKVNPKRP